MRIHCLWILFSEMHNIGEERKDKADTISGFILIRRLRK